MEQVKAAFPNVLPVASEPIPDALKRERRWLGWWAGPIKENGKFDKYPVDPQTGRKINPLDPANWLSFDEAMDAHHRDMAKGVGFVLSDQHPINFGGKPQFVIAIDLDLCGGEMDAHQSLWIELGQPYVEVSPSGKGLRMFAFGDVPLRGGNTGDGREFYSGNRFMTVTGHGAKGRMLDASTPLMALHQRWFPVGTPGVSNLPPQPIMSTRPETRECVALALSMLDHVSSDTDYSTWRDIVWAVKSTGWACADEVVHRWSKKTPHRYDRTTADKLLGDFKPSRGITLGTLAHHARLGGWTGSLAMVPATPPPTPTPPLPPLPPLPPPIPTLPVGPLLTASELKQLPAVPYVVRGLLPARGLAAIYGEPGSGKSFLALDLAHAISLGRSSWFGFPVQQAPVAYVALEGQSGMAKRVEALEVHTGQPCNDALQFWCRDFHLLSEEHVQFLAAQIVATIGTGAIVVIDTLNQASPGADENSSQDMGKMIASAKRVAAIVGGLVVLVHHAGKNRSQGLRGHSSLLAAMDVVIEVLKMPNHRKWHVAKAKDDSGDIARDFELVAHAVGQDAYGSIISCAVQQTAHVGTIAKAPIKGKYPPAAMAELRRLLSAPGQAIDYPSATQQVASVLVAANGRKRDRAKEAIEALIRGGHLSLTDGGIRLTD